MRGSILMSDDKKKHCTSIGGQAVIEGVMMRGPKSTAIAVRKPDGEIIIDEKPIASIFQKYKWLKMPIIRGCIAFFESMIVGVRALMFSADFFDIEGEEEETPSKIDLWLEKTFGDKLKDYVIYFSILLSLFFGIGLFIMLPSFLVSLFGPVNHIQKTLIESVIKLSLFVGYIVLISKMKDIQRVFEYHGAEHKTIHCYEAGDELTVENVKKYKRLHPRCGTSFLLIVIVVSIFVFMFIPNDLKWYVRAGFRLALLPFVAGLAYEIIKFAGRHDNPFTRTISAPGMAMQYLTTREPDDGQIEVAISALKAVKTSDKEEDKW